MALEVEKDISVIRFGKEGVALPPDRIVTSRYLPKGWGILRMLSRDDLEFCLVAQSNPAPRSNSWDVMCGVGQLDNRGDVGSLECISLLLSDPGHVHQGVFVSPDRLAVSGELAELAVWTRFGAHLGRIGRCVNHLGQPTTESSPVGTELVDSKGLDFA